MCALLLLIKKWGKVLAVELDRTQDNACACAYMLVLPCLCVCALCSVCVRKRERMHTSMPECVISVFSHRQRPKPSYKPRSWCYFCLWPGVMKLWCRKTSQPFLSACGSSQSSPQLQTDDDGCCPQSI